MILLRSKKEGAMIVEEVICINKYLQNNRLPEIQDTEFKQICDSWVKDTIDSHQIWITQLYKGINGTLVEISRSEQYLLINYWMQKKPIFLITLDKRTTSFVIQEGVFDFTTLYTLGDVPGFIGEKNIDFNLGVRYADAQVNCRMLKAVQKYYAKNKILPITQCSEVGGLEVLLSNIITMVQDTQTILLRLYGSLLQEQDCNLYDHVELPLVCEEFFAGVRKGLDDKKLLFHHLYEGAIPTW